MTPMLNSLPQELVAQWQRATSEPLIGASVDEIGTLGGQMIICVGPTALGYYDADGGLTGNTLTDFEALFRTDDGFAALLPDRPLPAYYSVDDDFADLVVATFEGLQERKPVRSGGRFTDRLERVVVRLFQFHLLGPLCAIVGFVAVSLTLAGLEAVGLTISDDDWRGGLLVAGAVVGWFGLRAPILMWLERRGYHWA